MHFNTTIIWLQDFTINLEEVPLVTSYTCQNILGNVGDHVLDSCYHGEMPGKLFIPQPQDHAPSTMYLRDRGDELKI